MSGDFGTDQCVAHAERSTVAAHEERRMSTSLQEANDSTLTPRRREDAIDELGADRTWTRQTT